MGLPDGSESRGVAGAVALDDHRCQLQRGHLLVRRPDAREVPPVRGVRRVHAGERHSYVCFGAFVGETIYGRRNGWLDLVGNPARDLADCGIRGVLPYDLDVAAPPVAALHSTPNPVSVSTKGMAVVKPRPALSREVVKVCPMPGAAPLCETGYDVLFADSS